MADSYETLMTVRPEDPPHEGCPVMMKGRHVTVNKGVAAWVEWDLRDRDGHPIDLSGVLLPAGGEDSLSISDTTYGSVRVRITTCDYRKDRLQQMEGESIAPSSGQVRFKLPSTIVSQSGVYRFDVGILNGDDALVLTDSGLLFVEHGLFGDLEQIATGPPTLSEIRSYIRDTRTENDFLRDVEFDNEELVTAIIAPVREWNETPPSLRCATFNCSSFPFREAWMKGIIGHLLRTASAWYLRNKMNITHGGVSMDDRNKNAEYTNLSMMYLQEWRSFVKNKKIEINARQGFGTVSGPYF